MKHTHFEYKCRRCGVIDDSLITSLPLGHMRAIQLLLDAVQGKVREPMAPEMVGTHCCEGGGMGLTDLIGYSVKGD
jgi:hypothetical protein